MNCEDAQGLLHVFVDGEFDAADERDMETHLRCCEACRRRAGFERWFRDGLRSSVPMALAPPELQARIHQQIRKIEPGPRPTLPAWALAPAALAIAAVTTLVVMSWETFESPPTRVVDAVQMHRQALPAEVSGSDPEVVRRWFWGKVNFPVRPPRPVAVGASPARFVGARVSHVGRFPAAHLMYDVGGARVSVMAFQGPPTAPTGKMRRFGNSDVQFDRMDGYNVAFSRRGDVTYAVTGDVDPAGMIRFLPAAAP